MCEFSLTHLTEQVGYTRKPKNPKLKRLKLDIVLATFSIFSTEVSASEAHVFFDTFHVTYISRSHFFFFFRLTYDAQKGEDRNFLKKNMVFDLAH